MCVPLQMVRGVLENGGGICIEDDCIAAKIYKWTVHWKMVCAYVSRMTALQVGLQMQGNVIDNEGFVVVMVLEMNTGLKNDVDN